MTMGIYTGVFVIRKPLLVTFDRSLLDISPEIYLLHVCFSSKLEVIRKLFSVSVLLAVIEQASSRTERINELI